LTGRSDSQIKLIEAYCKAQGLFNSPDAPEPKFSDTLEIDLGSVVPSMAGPRRPQDRVALTAAKSDFRRELGKEFEEHPSVDRDELAKWVAEGRKWSKSTIAAEQARRSRKGLPALNDAEMAALLGEPAAAAPATHVPAATPAAAAPRPAAAAASAAASVSRGGTSSTYVGTPAVGTSKAAAAGGIASIGPENSEINQQRRRLVWSAVVGFLVAWFIAFFRFFLPRTLFEPATSFKIGYPEEYGLGVDTKFQQRYRIWVDRTPDRIFVIYARCTHLGCTPDWKPSENKFKCPCHGSGYDSEGINFEGPAPRPMDRAKVEIAPDGQILVDVSRLYQWPKGQPSQFNDDGAFLRA